MKSFKGLKVVRHELRVSGTHLVSLFGLLVWGSIQVAHLRDSHREFLLRNEVGKICLWKKYILLYECIQMQGKKNF